MQRRTSRLAAVLIPAATAAVVFAIALPRAAHGPKQPLAADVWPGFAAESTALPDLGGLMLKLAVDRRDVSLETRLEDAQGRGFDWPVGDLYTHHDTHWVGLLEPGDWRIAIRRRDEPRPLAERRFSLEPGRTHGLALDLRTGLGDATETIATSFAFAPHDAAEPTVVLVASLDALFEARRASTPDPDGTPLALAPSADGTHLAAHADLAPGEYVLSVAPHGFEQVFHVGSEPTDIDARASVCDVELAFVTREGAALPAGVRVWWTSATRPGAPAILWHAPMTELGAEPLVIRACEGELRLVLQVPGWRKPEAVRVAVPAGGGRFEIPVGPRRVGAG